MSRSTPPLSRSPMPAAAANQRWGDRRRGCGVCWPGWGQGGGDGRSLGRLELRGGTTGEMDVGFWPCAFLAEAESSLGQGKAPCCIHADFLHEHQLVGTASREPPLAERALVDIASPRVFGLSCKAFLPRVGAPTPSDHLTRTTVEPLRESSHATRGALKVQAGGERSEQRAGQRERAQRARAPSVGVRPLDGVGHALDVLIQERAVFGVELLLLLQLEVEGDGHCADGQKHQQDQHRHAEPTHDHLYVAQQHSPSASAGPLQTVR